MSLFKKEINKNPWMRDIPRNIWESYLDARDLEDQTLAKEIANKYGIDYDEPVITRKMYENNMCMIESVRRYREKIQSHQEEDCIKNIVISVLKENGLINR